MGLPSTFADIEDRQFENCALIPGLADGRMTNYPLDRAMTWHDPPELSAPARRLFERLVWLSPKDPMPNFLIEVRVPGIADEDIEEAFDDLARHSWVLRSPRNQEFRLHRSMKYRLLAQRHLKRTRRNSLDDALGWVTAAFPFDADESHCWPQAEALAPHARAVTKHAIAAGIFEPTTSLMNQLALLLSSRALNAEAEPLFRQALTIDENCYGPRHLKVATRLNNLAVFLHDMNRVGEAEPLYRRALGILTQYARDTGRPHPDFKVACANYALTDFAM